MSNLYEVKIIPILQNNFIFLVENKKDKTALAVDPGTSQELINYLEGAGLSLQALLLTHHHWDHIEGIPGLLKYTNDSVKIFAPALNRSDIQQATNLLSGDETIVCLGLEWKVFSLPGHTLGHIAYYNAENGLLFSGDVLFGLGCGRLFEGSFQQQYESLSKIKTLPADTQVFCTHEYTKRNLEFCRVLQQEGKLPVRITAELLGRYEEIFIARMSNDKMSVPLALDLELACNPFLVVESLEEFTELRKLRNSF